MVKKLFRLLVRRNYRYLMIRNEGLPVYHDRFQISNKTIILVEKQGRVSDSSALIVEGKEYSSTFNEIRYKHKKAYSKIKLECQNGISIQIYKNFKRHTGNSDFDLNGFKQGDTFEIKGLGFLGDIDVIECVFLVTDEHVFTKGIIRERVYCYKHEELQRMRDGGALKFL